MDNWIEDQRLMDECLRAQRELAFMLRQQLRNILHEPTGTNPAVPAGESKI